VLIRPLGIPRRRVAYRGDNQSCLSGEKRYQPSALEVICKHCGMVARNSDFDIEQFVSKDGCGTRHSVRRTATAERIGTQLASAVKRWLR
jgi:hypothetical protein